MKAVLLTSVAGNGGSAATAFHHARVLLRAGWEVTLFAPGDYWIERGRKESVPTLNSLALRRGFRPVSFTRDLLRFRRFLLDNRPDAVLVQKTPEQWLAALALESIRRPTALVRLRGVVFPIRPSRFNRWLHHRMDAVICSAETIARQYDALPGFDSARVTTLLEGVETERFTPATAERRIAARKRWKLDERPLLIGTAGRPAPVKGHDVLVRAFAQAFSKPHSPAVSPLGGEGAGAVRLCIFADESRRGAGSYANLDALCGELGIREQTHLIAGHVADMRDVYDALDVYVLPSRGSEGSSRAGLEASACGLPLLASRVGVLPELIEDGRTGRLLPPGDVDALAAALKETAESWPAARNLGAAARARMCEHFTEEGYAREVAKLLGEIVLARKERG